MNETTKIKNMKELHDLIQTKRVKGCAKCNTIFYDDEDFAFVLETGTCPCCNKVMVEVLRK